MRLKRLRAGELLALAGIAALVASLLTPTYHSLIGHLDPWDSFGPGVILELVALCAGLAMVISALTERDSTALPVATGVWSVPLGLLGTIAAVVRVLERPDHATSAALGAWLALGGCAAILVGAWLVIRDERPALYAPARPQPRPRP